VQLPDGVEWSIHSAWLLALAPDEIALPAHRLAEYYGLPEAYLAKVLKRLVRAGLLHAGTGPRGGFRLARDPAGITVLEIVEAVEGGAPLFRCTEIRQRGPVPASRSACRKVCGVARVMHDAERAWRARLRQTTLADLVASAGDAPVRRARGWLASLATRPN
jgi:Rrf2 family protein